MFFTIFLVDTDAVADALRVPKDKIESKGIKSVRSRVTNLKPYVSEEYKDFDTFQFRDELIKLIWGVDTLEEAQQYEYQLDDEDKKGIEEVEQKLYKNWDWVYGKSPEFTVKRRKHFTSGTIDARFLVEDGKIKDIKIYGDFFGSGDVKDVEDALRGLKYDVSTIKETLGKLDLNKYFVGIDAEDVKELISTQQ